MSDSGEYQIPDSWFNTTIEEVCTNPQYGYTTRASKIGDLKLLRTTDITSGTIKWDRVPFCSENPDELEKYKLYDGDVVISRSGSIGMSYLIKTPTNSVFASYLIRFKPLINKQFFKYFLDSPFYWSAIGENKLGIAVQNINATKLKEISLPLPPLNEQKRIVNKIEELLSELDHAVESFKKIQQQLKIYRQAVLKAAFEGKLTEGWRRNNQIEKKWLLKTVFNVHEITDVFDFSENFESQLPPIPSSWEWVYLKRLGELARGKSKHRPRNDSKLFGGEYPFVQTGEIKAANPYLKSFHQTYSEIGLSQSRLWDRGTLCITIAANIAETAILDIKACFPDSIVGFTSDLNKVLTKYILYFIQASKAKIQAYAPATAQKNINLATLQGLVIPYCSLEEQSQIVQEIESRLSICDELEKTIEQNLILEKSLRQSILKKAFEGKLVPQDPNDEPAELLLEKIKLEKEKLAKLTNSSKTKTKREKVTA